jgi:hypothetical protein
MDMATVVAAAAVEGVIGLAIYLGIRRPLDQLSTENGNLRRDVVHLRDDQVKALADRVERHEKRFGYIERGYVSSDSCEKMHRETRETGQKVIDAAIKIAGVQKDAERAIQWLGDASNQLIAAKADVAGLTARLEAMEDRLNRRNGDPQ